MASHADQPTFGAGTDSAAGLIGSGVERNVGGIGCSGGGNCVGGPSSSTGLPTCEPGTDSAAGLIGSRPSPSGDASVVGVASGGRSVDGIGSSTTGAREVAA